MPAFEREPSSDSNGLAVAAMVLGIVGIFIWILAPVALIMGIVGYRQARKKAQKGAGMAVAAIMLGAITMFGLLLFFWVIASAL